MCIFLQYIRKKNVKISHIIDFLAFLAFQHSATFMKNHLSVAYMNKQITTPKLYCGNIREHVVVLFGWNFQRPLTVQFSIFYWQNEAHIVFILVHRKQILLQRLPRFISGCSSRINLGSFTLLFNTYLYDILYVMPVIIS